MYGTPDLLGSVVSNSDLKEDIREKRRAGKGVQMISAKVWIVPTHKTTKLNTLATLQG